MKIFCPKCNQYAETTEALIRHGKNRCGACDTKIKRDYVARRRAVEPDYATGKGSYPQRREAISKLRKARRRADPAFREAEISANHRVKLKKLGLTVEQFEKMVEAQRNLCAICDQPETRSKMGRVSKLAVDHDHVTGKIRALLCYRHNVGLGAFSTPEIARSAIRYLQAGRITDYDA